MVYDNPVIRQQDKGTSGGQLPTLVSVIFNMDGERGHVYSYNKSVNEAANLLDWNFRAIVHKDSGVSPLPAGWTACIEKGNFHLTRNPLRKIRSIFLVGRAIAKYISELKGSSPRILFLEYFTTLQLLATVGALRCTDRRNLFVWLLYRHPIHDQNFRKVSRFHNLLDKWMYRWTQMLTQSKTTLFSDTQPLAQSLSMFLGDSVSIMPIPHVPQISPEQVVSFRRAVKVDGCITAWWPGPPREEKGLEIVRIFCSRKGESFRMIRIVASKASELRATEGGCNLLLVPADMKRRDYLQWLYGSDLILLPYDPMLYAERSSGIFIEAICAGSLPVVTAGTWAAAELQRFELQELCLSVDVWHAEGIVDLLVKFTRSETIRCKLQAMQENYIDMHGIRAYARAMQRAWVKLDCHY
jgi:hypothetical protein